VRIWRKLENDDVAALRFRGKDTALNRYNCKRKAVSTVPISKFFGEDQVTLDNCRSHGTRRNREWLERQGTEDQNRRGKNKSTAKTRGNNPGIAQRRSRNG